jgi:hypothetical protein
MSKSSENITEDQEQPGIAGPAGLSGGRRRLAGAAENREVRELHSSIKNSASIQTTFFLFSAV